MFRISVLTCGFLLGVASLFAAEELRTWKDASGSFSLEARFVKLADGVVHLESAAGQAMKIPLTKLAAADAQLAQELAAKTAPAAAPAEMRTWSDASGKFTLQGKFDKLEGDTVYLVDQAGKSMKIPLSKLSAADQEYVKARPAANPFEDLGSAGKSGTKAATPGKVFAGDKPGPAKLLRPDWTKAKILLPNLANGKWRITLPELATRPPLTQAAAIKVPLPGMGHSESLYSLRYSEEKQRLLLCLHGFATSKSRFLMYNAATGEQLGQAEFDAKYNLLDVAADGEHVLVGGNGINDRDFVEIWSLTPRGIIRERGWSNKAEAREFWTEVKSAVYVDEKRALIVQAERLTLFDTVSGNPLAVMRLKRIGLGEPVFAYHARAKLLAVQQGRELCVIELQNGEVVAGLTLGDDDVPNALAWRPDAKQLALRTTLNKLLILDTASGERVREVDLSELQLPFRHTSKLDWPAEHQILINRGLVYDLRHNIPLWEYEGLDEADFHGGHAWCWFDAGRSEPSSVVPLLIPHQAVRELADKYQPPARVLLMPAGTPVMIDTTEIVDPTIQEQANKKLAEHLRGLGYDVTATAECRLFATMAVGPTKELVWRDFTGNKQGEEVRRNFSPIICKMQLKDGDRVVWEKQSSGYPLYGRVQLREGETIDTKIAEQEKPRYELFLKPKIPKYKPSDNDKALGKSKLTAEGLQ